MRWQRLWQPHCAPPSAGAGKPPAKQGRGTGAGRHIAIHRQSCSSPPPPPRSRPPPPQPVLSFIQPQNIDITLPSFSLPKPDITIPVLPAPKVSFLQPDALNTVGGSLNVQRKVAVIDASRLGPEKTYEVNLPSTPIDAMPPVKVGLCCAGARPRVHCEAAALLHVSSTAFSACASSAHTGGPVPCSAHRWRSRPPARRSSTCPDTAPRWVRAY